MGAKTDLVELCQRILGRSLNGGDITYEVTKIENQHQASVSCVCLDGSLGKDISGELKSDKNEAEADAAAKAMDAIFEELTAKYPGIARETPDSKPKCMLFAVVDQLLKADTGNRAKSQDVVFDWEADGEGWVGKVTLPTMESLSSQVFQGEASPFKRDAMLSGAQAAVTALLEDATLGSKIDVTEAEKEAERKKTRDRRGGRSNSEKKMDQFFSDKGKGKTKDMMMSMLFWGPWGPKGMFKGKGKGKGKGKW